MEDTIITIIHELAHGFGLPHRCWHWDHREGRAKSCVMNYSADWILGKEDRVDARSVNNIGRHFCAFHLIAMRSVRLEANPALGWNAQPQPQVPQVPTTVIVPSLFAPTPPVVPLCSADRCGRKARQRVSCHCGVDHFCAAHALNEGAECMVCGRTMVLWDLQKDRAW